MNDKLRLDMSEMTLGELADASELLGKPLAEVIQGVGQMRAIAALACVVKRRTDPAFTLDQALRLHPADLEVIGGDDVPEVLGASNGASLLASLDSGDSTPPT